jgi:hypothetical protein
MKIENDEITPGLVAWLDQAVLTNDKMVVSTYPQLGDEVRPFVCFESDRTTSSWAPLTAQY